MIRLIALLIPLALLVAGSVWLADRPGAVSIDWLGWRLQTSVPVLLLLVVIATLVLITAFRTIVEAIALPGRLTYRWRQRRQKLGYQALTDGLAAAASGQSRRAQKLAKRAERLLADPALTAFLAAQSAQLAGDETRAQSSYESMLARPETMVLGLRGLLRQAIERRDDKAAIELARRARMASPADPYPATVLYRSLLAQGHYREAAELAREAGRTGAFADANRHRAIALHEQAGAAARNGDMRAARDLAQQAAKLAPDFPPAAARLAELLAANGRKRAAIKELARAWARQPAEDLAKAARVITADASPLDRYQQIERMTADSPERAATHLIRGQAALEAGLWGQARRLLLAASDIRPDSKTYRLLAQLEIAEYGNRPAATAWTERAAAAPATIDWTCASCNGKIAEWSLICPHCGDLGSLSILPAGGAQTSGKSSEKPDVKPSAAANSSSELASADGNG